MSLGLAIEIMFAFAVIRFSDSGWVVELSQEPNPLIIFYLKWSWNEICQNRHWRRAVNGALPSLEDIGTKRALASGAYVLEANGDPHRSGQAGSVSKSCLRVGMPAISGRRLGHQQEVGFL